MPRINFFNHVLEDLSQRCEIIDIKETENIFSFDRSLLISKIKILNSKKYSKDSIKSYFLN